MDKHFRQADNRKNENQNIHSSLDDQSPCHSFHSDGHNNNTHKGDKQLQVHQHNSNLPVSQNCHSNQDDPASHTVSLTSDKWVPENLMKVLMVLSSRLLYILHIVISIWRVTTVLSNIFWLLSVGILIFFVDVIFVLVRRKGKEWTWFQPIVLFYLLLEMPCIWLLELHRTSKIQVENNHTAVLGNIYKDHTSSSSVDFGISNDTWALLLEQSMLVLIIIARWMMPKGDFTREQLSALLLSYLGVASDVVDFLSVLAESDTLLLDLGFVFTILSTWSWSMCQFIFVTNMVQSSSDTVEEDDDDVDIFEDEENYVDRANNPHHQATQAQHSRSTLMAHRHSEHLESDNIKPRKTGWAHRLHAFIESEMWSIFVSILMQDGPYVVVRLVCVFHWKIRTYTNYFFTAKNCLVLVLQVYRIAAVYQEFQRKEEEKEKKRAKHHKKMLHLIAKGKLDKHDKGKPRSPKSPSLNAVTPLEDIVRHRSTGEVRHDNSTKSLRTDDGNDKQNVPLR